MATAIRGYKNRRIMKKEYIKPEILVEEFLLDSSILSLSAGEATEDDLPSDANQLRDDDRRGNWGNLWD